MTEIPLKPKNDQNTSKPKKLPKHPRNLKNDPKETHKTIKMNKVPP